MTSSSGGGGACNTFAVQNATTSLAREPWFFWRSGRGHGRGLGLESHQSSYIVLLLLYTVTTTLVLIIFPGNCIARIANRTFLDFLISKQGIPLLRNMKLIKYNL